MHNPTHTGNSGVNSLGGGVGPIVAGPTARGETSLPAANVTQQFHTFLADIEELVKDVTSLNGEELAQAKFKLNARIATAKTATEIGAGNIIQRARHTAVVTNSFVHKQPWKAVGTGAALAFLLGRAFSKH